MANHPIHNFSHLLPPQYLIFGEISQIFILGRGVHQQIFWVFQLFCKSFHVELAQNDPQWQFLPPKWLEWAQNGQFWLNFNKALKYLSGILTDLHRIFRTGLVFPSWSKWVQGVLCYDQNWWKLKYLSRISIDMANFAKKWLDLAPNGQFWSFCRFFPLFPNMRLRLTWNDQFHPFHNFSHLYHQSVSFL